MTYSRMLDIEVDLATMRRRVDALEAHFLGSVSELSGPQPLFDTYAHLVLDGLTPGSDSAASMRSCAMLLSPRALLDLGRMTGDMFPWRPFLAALDVLKATGYDVDDALTWLEGTIQELLRAQGLSKLRIEDVLHSPVGPIHRLRRFALSGR